MPKEFLGEISPVELGAQIRQLRIDRGLKQAAFVGELISPGYISLIEQGKRMPSEKALAHIAQVLGVAVSQLCKPELPKLDGKQSALLAQIDVLLTLTDFPAAQALLAEVANDSLQTLQGRIIQAELDYGLGNFVASDMVIKGVLEDALRTKDWQIGRRAAMLYCRLSDRLNYALDATIYLSQIRRELKDTLHVDPLLLTQVTAAIADRLLSFGDAASANKLLVEIDELLPKVKDRRGRGSALWVSASLAYEVGDYEQATRLAQEARALFSDEMDSVPALVLQILYSEILVNCAPDGDSRLVAAQVEIESLIRARSSSFDFVMMQYAQNVYADLLGRLGDYSAASDIYFKILAQGGVAVDISAHVHTQLGKILAKNGNESSAKNHLDEAWLLLKTQENVTTFKRALLNLVTGYELLGDQARVIEVLKATQKPIGDLSAVLQD